MFRLQRKPRGARKSLRIDVWHMTSFKMATKTSQNRSPLTPQDTQDYELCSVNAIILQCAVPVHDELKVTEELIKKDNLDELAFIKTLSASFLERSQ